MISGLDESEIRVIGSILTKMQDRSAGKDADFFGLIPFNMLGFEGCKVRLANCSPLL